MTGLEEVSPELSSLHLLPSEFKEGSRDVTSEIVRQHLWSLRMKTENGEMA